MVLELADLGVLEVGPGTRSLDTPSFRGALEGGNLSAPDGGEVLVYGRYDLINFIVIEPIVRGRRRFSELEKSQLDNVPGKLIWAEG